MSEENLIHANASPDLSQSGQQSSVPTLTPGRIAFEGFYAKFPTFDGVAKQWDGSSEEIHERWEDAADAVIEECAKMAESHQSQHELNQRLASQIGRNVASAIRSLKSNPKGEDHDAG